jgi:hypothetical protein
MKEENLEIRDTTCFYLYDVITVLNIFLISAKASRINKGVANAVWYKTTA